MWPGSHDAGDSTLRKPHGHVRERYGFTSVFKMMEASGDARREPVAVADATPTVGAPHPNPVSASARMPTHAGDHAL